MVPPRTPYETRRLQEVTFTCANQRLSAALYVQLAIDVVDMAFDRADRDDERVSNCLVGMTIGNQAQHVTLTRTQRLDELLDVRFWISD